MPSLLMVSAAPCEFVSLRPKGYARFVVLCGLLFTTNCKQRRSPVRPRPPMVVAQASVPVNVKRLVVGQDFACAIFANHRVRCWGSAEVQRVPEGAFVSLGAGDRHVCGLREDHQVVCWGWNDYGQTRAPAEPFVNLDAAGRFACGQRSNGTAACWGWESEHRTAPPAVALRAIDVQDSSSCGLRANGTVVCWGDSLGVEPFGDERFEHVAVAYGLQCGLRANGTLRCAGLQGSPAETPAGAFRELTSGVGSAGLCGITMEGNALCFGDRTHNLGLVPSGPFVRVAPGEGFACGLRPTGALACWGALGLSSVPSGAWEEIALGERFGCARSAAGRVVCFGGAYREQTHSPTGTFLALAAGPLHTCGLRTQGTVACWGAIAFSENSLPRGRYTTLASGPGRSCAIATSGRLSCWGALQRDAIPTEPVVAVGMGPHIECAVLASGAMRCWGANASGLDVWAVRDAHRVTVSEGSVRALRSNGASWCFERGYFGEGRRGGGSMQGSPAPRWMRVECHQRRVLAVAGMYDLDTEGAVREHELGLFEDIRGRLLEAGPFTSIAGLAGNACGVHRDGSVHCWGRNEYGQSSPPTGRFLAVTVGEFHACAIREDHTVVCWGSYAEGEPL